MFCSSLAACSGASANSVHVVESEAVRYPGGRRSVVVDYSSELLEGGIEGALINSAGSAGPEEPLEKRSVGEGAERKTAEGGQWLG